jgi:hypothetical protein
MLPQLFASQLLGGTLLLIGMVPLGVVILAPVIVNIVLFHVFLAPEGLPLAIVVAALGLFLGWTHRRAYRPLFATPKVPSASMGTPVGSATARP